MRSGTCATSSSSTSRRSQTCPGGAPSSTARWAGFPAWPGEVRAMRASKRIALLFGLAGLWGCGGSRSEPVVVRSEGIEIAVAVAPAAARVGPNAVWIDLRDASGNPVPGADVSVSVSMHAMGAMPAMGGTARVTAVGGGRYRADFALGMGGTWTVAIAVQGPGAPGARAEGSLTVGTPGV